MNIKKTVKKIAALVAGTTMLGATIMGAMALDLSDYPAPFVTDGDFDGKIVVGEKAATSDVVGAIDIAASLQAEATLTTEINIPGAAGTDSIIGDAAEFKTGSDIVRIGEAIGGVKATFTSEDLDALASGVFLSSPVKQYLKFGDTNYSVQYLENDDDEIVDAYLYVPDDSYLFEFHLDFTEGAESDIDGTEVEDLEGEVLTIIGAPFTVVEAELDNGNDLKLVMLGGEVADVLRDGETKTYTINGVDYEVTAVFIDSSATPSAKLSVNGMMTKQLEEGETDILDDVTIGVQEILTNQREGLVEFYLGANKLEMTDTDFEDSAYEVGASVKSGDDVTVDNADLIIKATNTTDELTLNYIKYRVQADEELFIAPGTGVREYLYEPEGMLTETWDVTYTGLMETGVSMIEFDAKSDHSYELDFENVNGDEYSFPYITNKDGSYEWGDDDDEFIFVEATTETNVSNITAQDTFLTEDDWFIVSDGATGVASDTAVVNILRYQSIRTSDNKITFKDLAGDVMEVSYDETTGQGELIVSGESHYFWVGADPYPLAMDLDASGAADTSLALGADEVLLVVKGGGIADLGAQTFTAGAVDALAAAVAFNLTTPADNFDESTDTGVLWNIVTVNESGTDEITLSIAGLTEWHENDEYDVGMNSYGAHFKLHAPDTGARELEIEYPLVQRGAQVFVTAGVIEVAEGASAGGGTISTTSVLPIEIGLAVLDTNAPALGSEPMIVVGGPCANTVAMALLGNPEVCSEGFEPGKATIKLFADQNAILVAGYEAQETLGASYVLADYEDWALTGTEVEVVVTDLTDMVVNPVG